jgi:small-conductance mechanosensitive channel/CRP-like cAMP-binding protein
MHATPLQTILRLSLLSPTPRMLIEAIVAAVFGLAMLSMRWLKIIGTSGLMMCALGFVFDLVATPSSGPATDWTHLAAAAGEILVAWGLISLSFEAATLATRRRRDHFSTIFKDIVMFLLYGMILLAVLRVDYHVDPTPLLASTAVVAVVAGLALQESLGNIFSGLTLQLSKPFVPGDWIRLGTNTGRVQGIGWRSTAVVTRANEKLEIPNAMLAKEVLVNYSNGLVADEIAIGLGYGAPPNYVRQVILQTLRDAPAILQNPPPEILTWSYGDYALQYRVKYWISDYGEVDQVRDTVATSMWYALHRRKIEIPFPVRTLRLHPDSTPAPGAQNFEREIMQELRAMDFLSNLGDEELRMLAAEVTVLRFGAGEVIVREGDQGESLYLIRDGTVEVVAMAPDGKQMHIRDLRRPAFFGEIALMTGEPRSATIRARTDAELVELSRDGFTELFKAHPETAAQIGEVIALRMTETRELLAAAPHEDGVQTGTRWFIGKMRAVFNLTAQR